MDKKDVELLITIIDRLKTISLHEAREYCEPERLEPWVQGYLTAVDDILDILKQG